MKLTAIVPVFAGLALAQHVFVPDTCIKGFEAGKNVALVTLPYTYAQVISIIGSYKNLTWSGNPDNTVTLNGTDNKVHTARTYVLPGTGGTKLIETITEYSKPKNGPYNEVHTTAEFTIAPLNLTAYIIYDGTVVKEVCGGKASQFNFTAIFCANNKTLGAGLLDQAHTTDALTVGKFLGGANFTSCSALNSMAGSAKTGEAHPPVKMMGAGLSVAAAVFVSALMLM